MGKKMEIFVQCEGSKDVVLMEVDSAGVVADLVHAAKSRGLLAGDDTEAPNVFIEGDEEALSQGASFKDAGVGERCHVHIHRCNVVEVTVGFNSQKKSRSFPVSTTIFSIKQWAAQVFQLAEVDAAEHVLQISGSKVQPDEDAHVGTLVNCSDNQLAFDLIPKVRVEG